LSKFDPDGNYQWVRTFDHNGGWALAVDNLDYIYVAYGFSIAGLVKYDLMGSEQWSRVWGCYLYSACHGLAVDGINNVFVSGVFKATVDFDPGPGIEEHESEGLTDAFISKFTSSGDW
jgi:hypothetical protein